MLLYKEDCDSQVGSYGAKEKITDDLDNRKTLVVLGMPVSHESLYWWVSDLFRDSHEEVKFTVKKRNARARYGFVIFTSHKNAKECIKRMKSCPREMRPLLCGEPVKDFRVQFAKKEFGENDATCWKKKSKRKQRRRRKSGRKKNKGKRKGVGTKSSLTKTKEVKSTSPPISAPTPPPQQQRTAPLRLRSKIPPQRPRK